MKKNRRCRLAIFAAALLISSGCAHEILEPVPSIVTTVPVEKGAWQALGTIGGHCPGVRLIAFRPDPKDRRQSFAPFIATANAPVYPPDVRVSVLFNIDYLKAWGGPQERIELFSTFIERGISSLAFNPDGSSLLYSSREGVVAWHFDERRFETRFAASGDSRFTISSDGRFAAEQTAGLFDPERSVSAEQPVQIRIIDLESRAELSKFGTKSSWTYRLIFSPRDERIFGISGGLGSDPKEVIVWNRTTGEKDHCFPIDTNSVSTALSPDGDSLAIGILADAVIQVWNTRTGELHYTAGRQEDPGQLVFSPNGKMLVSAGSVINGDKRLGEIKVWDAANGRELASIYDESSWGMTALMFSPDGKTLACGNADGLVILRKVPDF